jgi:hypothetical protein
VARGSLLSCMMYVANCPCGKGLIIIPSQLPSLARGLLLPSLVKGLLWPSSTDASSLVFLLYSPLATYTLSSAYLLYLPLATYTPSWTYLAVIFGVLAVPDLSVFVLLFVAWSDIAVVASCKQQHIIFDCCVGVALVLPSHLSGIVIAPCNMTRNDCHIVDVVVVSLRSMSLLALHAFAIVDVVDPHQSQGRLLIMQYCALCCCNQP